MRWKYRGGKSECDAAWRWLEGLTGCGGTGRGLTGLGGTERDLAGLEGLGTGNSAGKKGVPRDGSVEGNTEGVE